MTIKVCFTCKAEKDTQDFHAVKESSDGLHGSCKECVRSWDRARYKAFKRKQECKDRASKYYYANREKVLAQRKEYNANHRPERAMLNAKRRAKMNKAMPKFANKQYMNDLYAHAKEASDLFKSFGVDVQFQVDHIIPLNGDNVSGFHSEQNMQILSLRENTSKSKKFNSDLYATQWCNV